MTKFNYVLNDKIKLLFANIIFSTSKHVIKYIYKTVTNIMQHNSHNNHKQTIIVEVGNVGDRTSEEHGKERQKPRFNCFKYTYYNLDLHVWIFHQVWQFSSKLPSVSWKSKLFR